jgi:hypothetical protein
MVLKIGTLAALLGIAVLFASDELWIFFQAKQNGQHSKNKRSGGKITIFRTSAKF